jgi:hypothetical protein
MPKMKRVKGEDKRTPKHSGDAGRPSKSVKGNRDAATVRIKFTYPPAGGFHHDLLVQLQARHAFRL